MQVWPRTRTCIYVHRDYAVTLDVEVSTLRTSPVLTNQHVIMLFTFSRRAVFHMSVHMRVCVSAHSRLHVMHVYLDVT